MNIHKRFMNHLLLGVGVWIILLGVTLPITLELILPWLGLGGESYEWIGLIVIGVVTIVCFLLFGWHFGSPLFLIIKWINQLAHENFSEFRAYEQMYTRRGRLKMRYRLYQKVFTQLEEMRLQLEKANHERAQVEIAKRDWITGISHDLKTPLTYIKGYSRLLLNADYHWSNKEKRKFIQEIDDKCTHMEQLVQDLNIALRFDDSRKVPLEPSRQNIVTAVQHVLADVSNDLRAQHHHFELQATEEDIPAAFDVHLFNRALQNLYMNSVLHNKSSVNILTTIYRKKQQVIINIQDDGVGMTEETKRHLFNRYYRGTTTDQTSAGTGLGMAIVKQLIEAHDGSIRVKSSFEQGTTFIITLPIHGR